MSVEIRRGSARFVERAPGRLTRHAFSFGPHYDPERLAFGPMVCHDEHVLGEGEGFDDHPHAGLDIVTWVLSGAVAHTSGSDRRVVRPGEVMVQRTGDGITHAEVAAEPQTRFVQVWLRSASDAVSTTVGPPPVTVGDATFDVVRLGPGESATLPEGLLHAYVASGALVRSSLAEPLSAGDAFLVTPPEPALTVTAAVDTELLVWQLG